MKNQSRRRFIRNLTVATVAAGTTGFPFITYGKPLSKQGKIGIALIGLGNYATGELAPSLQQTEKCYLAGIVTGTPSKEKIWADRYNIPQKNIYNYDNFDSIADNKDIDAVYVVLPNSMHKEYVIRAAKAGKQVLCEKPMALNAAECRDMIAACKEAGVFLSIGYRLHYEPYNMEIIKIGEEERYGHIQNINAADGFYMQRPTDQWRTKAAYGGGAMMDMGVYALQAARYATGKEPISVSAQRFNPDPQHISEVDETTTFQLEFPGGTTANCLASFGAQVNFLKINAMRGTYGLEPFMNYNGLHGFLPNGKTFDFDMPKRQQALQMDSMCEAIIEGRPSKTPGEEGLRDMVIVDAIKESCKQEGKKIVL